MKERKGINEEHKRFCFCSDSLQGLIEASTLYTAVLCGLSLEESEDGAVTDSILLKSVPVHCGLLFMGKMTT